MLKLFILLSLAVFSTQALTNKEEEAFLESLLNRPPTDSTRRSMLIMPETDFMKIWVGASNDTLPVVKEYSAKDCTNRLFAYSFVACDHKCKDWDILYRKVCLSLGAPVYETKAMKRLCCPEQL